MIVIKSKSLVVVTPPKCGSSSAHHAWTRRDVGGIWVVGPQMDDRIDKHTKSVPWDFEQYRRVCLIRNPFSRAKSLLNHRNQYHSPSISIDDYIPSIVNRSDPFTLPVAEWYDTNRMDEFWPIEFIDLIADQYGLPPLETLNAGKGTELPTGEQAKRLEPWAAADRELHSKAIAYWKDKLSNLVT